MTAQPVARYLTVAGVALSHPDIAVDVHRSDEYRFSAKCAGCGPIAWGTFNATTDSEDAMRRRAQAHAETCRAMPTPAN